MTIHFKLLPKRVTRDLNLLMIKFIEFIIIEDSATYKVNSIKMVDLRGLEPLTSSMPWKRSSQLSYRPINIIVVNSLTTTPK